MFTIESLGSAKRDLDLLIGKMAYRDYKAKNYTKNGKKKSKKHIPYSLGADTMDAKKLYNAIYGKSPEDIGIEIESAVKGFLIKYRRNNMELL